MTNFTAVYLTPKTMNKLLLTALLGLCPYLTMGQPSQKTIKKSPLIGISCSHPGNNSSTRITYSESVIQAGGIPMLIPITTDSIVLTDIINRLDGIMLIGGGDIHPSYFNESPIEQLGEVDSLRDAYDIALIRMAARRNIPMLGICRGEQLINVAFGGTLYQDIPSQYPDTTIRHNQIEPSSIPTHIVYLLPGSDIANMTGQIQLHTNTHHHQAVKQAAPGFKITAWTTDSIPEAIESSREHPIWGVQFHPEALTLAGDSISARFFHFLVKKAATYRQAKEIHSRILSLDSHTDTPLDFDASYNIGTRTRAQVCLPKMEEGKLDGQYLACWVRQGPCDEINSQKAVRRVDELIKGIYRQVEMNQESCAIARTANDLAVIKSEGKKAFYIGIENGYGIGKDISNIARFKDLGITYITLCHTRNNDICDSSSDSTPHWNGLSPFGKKVVKEMNRLGITIDLSHAAESTFWDVLKYSKKPVIASHSSASSIYRHDRNLTDDQLRALAAHGGVAQACLVNEFLSPNAQNASLTDFMNHLLHMIRTAGINHVGIGSDFDGGGGVKGCNGDNDLINITVRLLEHGFTETDIAKIWGGNYLRVMEQVQSK